MKYFWWPEDEVRDYIYIFFMQICIAIRDAIDIAQKLKQVQVYTYVQNNEIPLCNLELIQLGW